MSRTLRDDEVPYFSWDRPWTVAEIRDRLKQASGTAGNRLAAWILREAAFADVWRFLEPQEVSARFGELEPYLGRRREFWRYICTWHELGKL